MLEKFNIKNTILILAIFFTVTSNASDKCSNGKPACGSEKICCAPGYMCKSNKCVYDKNTKAFKVSVPKLPEIRQTKASRAKAIGKPIEIKTSLPGNYGNSRYQVRSASLNNSALYKQMKNADQKIYRNLPKGNYVRCYNGEVEKISTKSRASLHSCKGKGGVFEYRVNSK